MGQGTTNHARPLLELILGRPLRHRPASGLHRLLTDLGTGITIEQEPAGVNLFAVVSA